MSNIPKKAVELLQENGISPQEAMWNCHGTWVMKHWACEMVGAALKIKFNKPEIVERDVNMGVIVLLVSTESGEWTYGEVSKSNCKNSYPWAMAEKRAKDRLILKAAGLHGVVYSQEESDDFKQTASAQPVMPVRTALDAYHANYQSIIAIRKAFDEQDYTHLVQCWDEITGDAESDTDSGQNDKTLLWVAPTKYEQYGLPEPVFSTELRAWLKENASKYR